MKTATVDVTRQLVSVTKAAEYLGLSEGTIRNWLSAGRLEYVKVGRATRIKKSVLDRLIANGTIAATADDAL